MDTETLISIVKNVAASVLAMIVGYIGTTLGLRAYGALMDAIPPGAWLVIAIVALVVVAATVGFLFGTTLP